MHSILTRPAASLAILCALLCALVLAGQAPATPVPLANAPAAAPASFDARMLAADRSLPLAEAQRRIDRQAAAAGLQSRAVRSLGEEFGGVWIDPASGRVKLGVTEPTSHKRAVSLLPRAGLARGADVVAVEHGFAQLERVVAWISERVGRPESISAGIATDRNVVVLHHADRADLNRADGRVLDAAVARFGKAVQLDRDPPRVEPMSGSCETVAVGAIEALACSPPLRGGTMIETDEAACTAAFAARLPFSHYAYRLLTAGHCLVADPDSPWQALTFGDGNLDVGNPDVAAYGPPGDFGAIRIAKPFTWKLPRAWVMVSETAETNYDAQYPIVSDASSLVGQRVCATGASSRGDGHAGSECGTVEEVGMTFKSPAVNGLPAAKLTGMVSAKGLCAGPGDSGAPVYASNAALGILHGRPGGPCSVAYTPIATAESKLGVEVLHEAPRDFCTVKLTSHSVDQANRTATGGAIAWCESKPGLLPDLTATLNFCVLISHNPAGPWQPVDCEKKSAANYSIYGMSASRANVSFANIPQAKFVRIAADFTVSSSGAYFPTFTKTASSGLYPVG